MLKHILKQMDMRIPFWLGLATAGLGALILAGGSITGLYILGIGLIVFIVGGVAAAEKAQEDKAEQQRVAEYAAQQARRRKEGERPLNEKLGRFEPPSEA